MAGYYRFSKSNNALEAEKRGLMTKTKLAKALKCSTAAIAELLLPEEWHHTSKFYNATDYYEARVLVAVANGYNTEIFDKEKVAEARGMLEKLRAYRRPKRGVEVYRGCTVKWVAWTRVRGRRKAFHNEEKDCVVMDKGTKMVTVELPSGETLRKMKEAKGFEVWSSEGERII